MYIRLLSLYFFSNMILFYSEFCQHCTVLLDTIKRHDKNNMIKTVSIDLLRSLNKPIDPAIHSVPALLLLNTKEYLFGKNVFDYLLLPNRGVLFSNQVSSREKGSKDTTISDTSTMQQNTQQTPDEPQAFTLGAISAEQFSSIDDINNGIEDKNYSWGMISEESTIISGDDSNKDTNKSYDDSNKKNLPTMEEIMKQRASDIM